MKSSKPVKSIKKNNVVKKPVAKKPVAKKPVVKVAPKKVEVKKPVVAAKKTAVKVAPKKVVAKKIVTKKPAVKVETKVGQDNNKDLVKSVLTFLNNNEKIIKLCAENVNKYQTHAEQLANLIVGLITNNKVVTDKSKNSLRQIMEAAMSVKSGSKAANVKKAPAKKIVGKK